MWINFGLTVASNPVVWMLSHLDLNFQIVFLSLYICCKNPIVCHLLTFITDKSFFLSTRYVIPRACLRNLSTPFIATVVIRFTISPLGEVGSAAAIGPHPPVSPSSLKSDPAGCHMTAQCIDQPVLVMHAVHSDQVRVLHSAEALSLKPGQGAFDEVVLLRCFGQRFRYLKNAETLLFTNTQTASTKRDRGVLNYCRAESTPLW